MKTPNLNNYVHAAPERRSASVDFAELDELAHMRKRFKVAEELEQSNRDAASEAICFYFGDQWADDVARQRKADGRPCFSLNKLPAILKQVLNEIRAHRPAIQVNPVSNGADEDTAEALQGLTRHVEAHSDGPTAYETAFLYMVIGGFGSWEIRHDYLPMSFDQDLFIDTILNPFSVYWGPSKKLDKSDALYCFVTADYDTEQMEAEFPGTELAGRHTFDGLADQAPGWATRDTCRVAKYYYIDAEESELVQLTDGRVVWWDDMKKGDRIATDASGDPIARKAERRTAWLGISNGVEWLQKPEKLPTDDIPVVSIFGDELMVDGELRFKGLVSDVMEAQKIFNYNSSAIAETMALGTKANWVATVEQIEPYMDIWRQANTRNMAVLPYKNVPNVPPPQKIATEPPIQAMSAARMQAADDLRSISGVYDATQSPNGGEESGRAILARRHQTVTGNANFTSQLGRGIKRTAQILLKLFPKIYDTARVVRITGNDEQPKQVVVHAGQPAAALPDPNALPEGIAGVFDVSVGTYDVTITTGTDETKRQDAVESLLALVAANPAMVPVIGDLIVNEMDFPGKKAIVKRLQKALPPNLQDNADNPTDPAQLQAHNTQLMQQNSQLMQQVQQITQALQTKQIESQSRERVEATKLQATQIAAQSRVEQANIAAQSSILKEAAGKHFDAVHDHALADKGQVHDMMQASHEAALKPPMPEGVTQ